MKNETENTAITTAFSIKEALSYGWKTFKKRPWYFIVFSLIIIGINAIPSIFGNEKLHPETFNRILSLIGTILSMIVTLGSINFVLKIYDNKSAPYSSIFEKWQLVLKFFLASILYVLIIFAGFILLIIPGIIWSIKFQFYPYVMVDRGTGIIESLKFSSKIVDNNKWKIFLFILAQALIFIVGFLLLGIGILVAIPVTMMAETYIYRKLSAGK
jgi:uncharacterized membrane protein